MACSQVVPVYPAVHEQYGELLIVRQLKAINQLDSLLKGNKFLRCTIFAIIWD